RGFGFEVILKENAGRRAFIEGLREFAAKLTPGGVGLFFYAGHGLQAKSINYLVPVDAVLSAEDDLKYEAVDVNDVLVRMEDARVRLSVVILDACRDNPFLRGARSVARGLAQIDAGRGTFIAYATAPGKTAADGDGENGLYTAELLRSLKVPGLPLEEVFKRTMDGVERQSAGQQAPWSSSSFHGEFFFGPPPGKTPAQIAAPPPAAKSAASAAGSEAIEVAFWNSIASSGRVAEFEEYLRQYPGGRFAGLARLRVDELKRGQAAVVVPPKPEPGLEPIERAYVATGAARLREAPNVQAKQVGALREGQSVQVLGKVKGENWYLVEQDGKPAGYVAAGLLEEAQAYRKRRDEEARQAAEAERQRQQQQAATPPRTTTPSPAQPVVGVFPQTGALPKPGTTFRDCAECPEMMVIPAGSFMMGSIPGEEEREGLLQQYRGYTEPRHQVRVGSLAVGRYEVTVSEFAAFMRVVGRPMSGGCYVWTGSGWDLNVAKGWSDPGFGLTERDPLVCVSWEDAKSYVAWLSYRTGKGYRLLTEAEWEYAARAGTTTTRHWGEAVGSGYANCDGCGSRWDKQRPSPVGNFRPNSFGLYDMLGNVWEWVEDCWNETYAGAPSDGSAWLAGNCGYRIGRGGSWDSNPANLRAAQRYAFFTGTRGTYLGFRVARSD
ncbi:MAG: SUMF1/EgtB/PvdO family nonheme iron enzyme, partial [Proteobacteria bacterium]|nr:SUMF1/EgtB/PvdO family nonheme iron enzyme [Pseudomonadota bacterium]